MLPSSQKIIEITTPYIQLGQFIKMIGLVGTGGEVKGYLNQQPIQVNQQPEQRRGRKLYPGDQIVIGRYQYLIKRL